MNAPKFARIAAKVLAGSADERVVRPPPPERREQHVSAVAAAIRARARRKRTLRMAGGAAAAAAVALAAVGLHHAHRAPTATLAPPVPSAPSPASVVASVQGDVLVVSGEQTHTAAPGGGVAVGDRVVVMHEGAASVVLSTGTRLTVEGGGDLAVLSQGATQIFSLASGAVVADVAKLKIGERFVVRTVDAEVEVRGTSFRVATVPSVSSCGGGTTTRVTVREGVVSVRGWNGESRVTAGESWPAGCDVEPKPLAAPPPTSAPRSKPAPAVAPAPLQTPSDLSAQNDLLDLAMNASRRGDTHQAIESLEQLLAKYPNGSLAEGASAERMRLLASSDSARAAQAARDYLRKYPSGFARSEAEAICHQR